MKTSFRRVMALMLCVFVLTAGTPFFVFAEPGQEPAAAEQEAETPSETASPTDAEAPACSATGEHVLENYQPAEGGKHTAVCALCGETVEQDCVYAEPAEWKDQGNGVHGTACTICGGLKTEACVFEDVVTPPTATEAGFTTHTCKVCGATVTDEETPAENERPESALLGDMNADGEIGADDARSLLRLSVSLEKQPAEKLPYGDLDHSGDIQSADARLALRCSVKLDPTPDRHEYTVTVKKAAACTATGELSFVCAYCGSSGEMTSPALGHTYQNISLKKPTCTESGKQVDRCTVCKEEKTVVLSALGHDWTDATPTKAKHCSRCGEIVAGWTEIDGKTYLFKEDGSPMIGKMLLNGLIFSFGKDGVSETGRTGRKPKVAVLGDSIVASIANYNVAKDFDMYGKVSLHVNTIETKRISGSSRAVLHEADGRGYDIVILMLGVNDLTYADSAWGAMYKEVLRKLKNNVPDALIYAHSILPINNSKTGASEKMWMVNAKNKIIRNAAEAEGVRYLGTPPGLLDANGQLPYGAASDGIHFGPKYCKIWYDWVKEQLK